ncbi:cell surface protein, partial [Streptococcus thermophilus]|nr:cell surface protein [Streptococcus thermophilus]
DRDFKISAATAKTYNQDTVDDNGISIWWLIGLGALGMLIVVLLILWLVLFLKKRRQSQD